MISGDIVGPLTTIYVEPPAPLGRGSAAGARGNAAMPFATLDQAYAAAVAALPAFSVIELAPGTYAPGSAPISPLLVSGVIQTNGNPWDVIIDATGTGLPCFDFSSTAQRDVWTVGVSPLAPGFRLRADPGVDAIKADGTGAPAGTFFNGALSISAVLETSGGLTFRLVSTLILANLQDYNNDAITIDRCGNVFWVGQALIFGSPPCTFTYDLNDPNQPTNGSGEMAFFGQCVWLGGVIRLAHQAGLRANAGNVLPQIVGKSFDVGPGPGFAKTSLQLPQGCQVAGIDFESPGSQLADSGLGQPPVISLACELTAHAGFAVAGAAVNQVVVNCNGAIVRADVQPGNGVVATFRGTSFDAGPSNGGISTVGTGTCVPPDGAPIGATPAVAPITTAALPFAVSGSYIVIPVADDATCLPQSVDNYTPTSCDIHVTIAAGNVNGAIFMF
jgi:hypothetical protein